MNISIGLPTSLGELINIKHHLDIHKSKYTRINLSFQLCKQSLWNKSLHTEAPDWPQKKILWEKYLTDIGQLFFSERPYILDNGMYNILDCTSMIQKFGFPAKKAELGHLLCKGKSLNLNEEYIVITTKVRDVSRNVFFPLSVKLWTTLKKLSQKYKIVILGEKLVEMRKEYDTSKNLVFGLYEQIITNIPSNRILDLTVPALGETVADLKDIQQDCLIMKEAKLTISIGAGGNSCLNTSVSNMAIGFRQDNHWLSNTIFDGRTYPNAVITKDWNHFIYTLESYL